MAANFQPGDDWTTAQLRDAQVSIYEQSVAPAHEAFQVSWQAYVAEIQGPPRPGQMPKDVSKQYAAFWTAYGMQAIEDMAISRASVQARRVLGSLETPAGLPITD